MVSQTKQRRIQPRTWRETIEPLRGEIATRDLSSAIHQERRVKEGEGKARPGGGGWLPASGRPLTTPGTPSKQYELCESKDNRIYLFPP